MERAVFLMLKHNQEGKVRGISLGLHSFSSSSSLSSVRPSFPRSAENRVNPRPRSVRAAAAIDKRVYLLAITRLFTCIIVLILYAVVHHFKTATLAEPDPPLREGLASDEAIFPVHNAPEIVLNLPDDDSH